MILLKGVSKYLSLKMNNEVFLGQGLEGTSLYVYIKEFMASLRREIEPED